MTPRLVLLIPLAAACASVAAQDGDVSACVLIQSDLERLACYDNAAGRASITPVEADEAARAAREALEAAKAEGGATRRGRETRDSRGDTLFVHEDAAYRDAIANAGRGSLLDSRWELAKDSKRGIFNFRAYKPVYLLPAFWTSDVNDMPSSRNPDNTVTTPMGLDALETKFQLSFKTKAVENLFGDNGDIWMGYTQSSRWQVYNGEESRPFRETNYEPEVLLVFRNGYHLLGWNGRMTAVGINHQSNGREDPLSRSWNRLMFNIGLDREDWALMLRPWVRISDGNDDDNPGIEDYVGRGDATLTHIRGRNEFSLMARHSLRGGDRSRGALQFNWGFPLTPHARLPMRGHLQVFHGYGESLIDYNHKATYVGLGISLEEWFSQPD
ncbi:phospholipase [Luteimonas aestuarii]|uniref:Phospholipase A1 n=1 Tax=Luteimonas aestuarii TaxID=453837 RepID=A0A4R5TJ88_9GAMM|nr:phospholipase A [Luteimonas aestuarii]TDK21540.1 phospholipase [Luteimonas aestuarii]